MDAGAAAGCMERGEAWTTGGRRIELGDSCVADCSGFGAGARAAGAGGAERVAADGREGGGAVDFAPATALPLRAACGRASANCPFWVQSRHAAERFAPGGSGDELAGARSIFAGGDSGAGLVCGDWGRAAVHLVSGGWKFRRVFVLFWGDPRIE